MRRNKIGMKLKLIFKSFLINVLLHYFMDHAFKTDLVEWHPIRLPRLSFKKD